MKLSKSTTVSIATTVIALLVMGGCATILKGNSQKVTYNSMPMGASVYVNGGLVGTTPFQLKMKSSENYAVEFRKDGFETKTIHLTNSVGAGWIIVDVLFGLIPVIVDAATGAWHTLDQTNLNATLSIQNAKN